MQSIDNLTWSVAANLFMTHSLSSNRSMPKICTMIKLQFMKLLGKKSKRILE